MNPGSVRLANCHGSATPRAKAAGRQGTANDLWSQYNGDPRALSPGGMLANLFGRQYDSYGYTCRSWDGGGQCGTVHRTVTNYSARINGGPCQDLWPTGNTLSDFVAIYR